MGELFYEELGNPEAPPLIILHGFFASSRNWRQVAEKLAAQFHVLVPDMRNHGASPHHPQMDYPTMAADLLHFMDKHGLASAHLLGHSMGGKVAMWFALHHPGRVAKLIVADIAPINYSHSFNSLITALKALPLAAITNRKQADELLAPAIPELSYRQFLLQNLVLKNGAYVWRVDLDIFYQTGPNIAAFPETAGLQPYIGPALFLAGSESGYVKAEAIGGLFPNAKLAVIADAGHWLHVQQPVVFVGQVLSFLQD
ncbi:MAG: alpha/beta fold hydrolase [Methylococcales bacterium]|nr:alpha/beta fold hydrolase [Methylococcales bacterium]